MRQTIIGNRYKILKKLGVGATGNVYKVRDLKNKRIVALKILSKQKTSSEAVQRFKREFSLLAGLHHPNLCSVYDFGMLKDRQSYFTMEYIDGKDILQATQGLPYEDIYPRIVELCRVLQYIHAKGLIHYDVKPRNVLIQQTGDSSTVKLMDFGLAGEQQIKEGPLIRGTFPYIAPELIKGFAVDHRADLYSLGVLLYEVFTRRSFQEDRESFVALLTQRIQRGSASPSKIVSDIPKGLEQLISRLLAFEPAGRFSHANEIVREINKIAGVNYAFETEKTLESYLLSSRFVGRNKEMSILTSLYEKACHCDGKVVLVTGDAGIGKTRLLKEFKVATQLKRSHCFIGYAYKNRTSPLEPFYDIFSELINYIEDVSDIKSSLAVLFKIFPDLPCRHLKRHLPKFTSLGPEQEKLRTFEALSELIGYCASAIGELVILLDDLHWADYLTIQFLEYLGRNIAGRKIFICGTSRKEELVEHLGLKMMILNLTTEGCLTQIELKPFRFKSLYSFLDSTITHGSNSSELTRYLMKKTGGNPFFVEEIMRTLLHKRGLNIGEKVDIGYFKLLTIPGTIDDVVLKRIEDLDQASQCVIKFGAMLLKDFSYDLMKQLTELEDTELSRSLWELKNRQVLIEEDNKYRFYHTTLRESLNKQIGYQKKRKLNSRIGKTLEIINRGELGMVVEDLAHYFINAKDRKKGVRYGLRAAKKSNVRYAFNQALRFYKGVLNLLPGKEEVKLRFDILQQLAHIEQFICYYDDAIKHYNKALTLKTGTIDQKIKIYVGIGIVYENKGKYKNALRIYKRSLGLLRKMNPGRLKILLQTSINVRICRARLIIRDYKGACKFNFDTIRLPKGIKGKDEIKLLSSIYQHMGVIEMYKGEYSKTTNYDKIISYYKKAYKCYKKINAEDRIATILTNLGVTYYRKFDLLKALNYHQKAIKISKKIGDQHGVMKGLYNVSDILKTRGHCSEAINNLQRALFISKKLGDSIMTGFLSLLLGMCLLKLCDYKNAKKSFEKALKIFDVGDLKPYKVYPIWTIGRFYYATGEYTLALRSHKKALRIFRNMGNQFYIAGLFIDISSVLIEIGEFSKAKKYIKEALKLAIATGLQDAEIECYIALCQINIRTKNYVVAYDYYEKGIRIAEELGVKQELLQFLLLASLIYYHERKYFKGVKVANKAVKLAKEINTKDHYVEALLLKIKNEIQLDIVSNKEITETMKEAKEIAKKIGRPELLWKVYFEYGAMLQADREYRKALDYYQRCIEIFTEVNSRIKNKSYKKSYLNHPERQMVFIAIDLIERLLKKG